MSLPGLKDWDADPEGAFEALLGRAGGALTRRGTLRPGSQAVYRTMWRAFCAWMRLYNLRFSQIDVARLDDFLHEGGRAGIGDEHRRRYLLLIGRCWRVAHPLMHAAGNPAETLMGRFAGTRDRVPRVLEEDLEARLRESTPAPARGGPAWRPVRDHAIVMLALLAGVRTDELPGLRIRHLRRGRESLHAFVFVPPVSPRPARRVPLVREVDVALRRWLDARAAAGFAGDLLFPALPTRAARPIHRRTIYQAVANVLGGLRIDAERHGMRLLRGGFIVRQVETNMPPEEVARLAGLRELRSLAPYERAARIGAIRSTPHRPS